jgi:lipid II:glycine glycyltransferase (peptidoglycan interpeptide bridge formation enzyme)
MTMFILKIYFNRPFENYFHFKKLNVMLKELKENVKKSKVKSDGPSLLKLDNDENFQVIKDEKLCNIMTCLAKVSYVQCYNLL